MILKKWIKIMGLITVSLGLIACGSSKSEKDTSLSDVNESGKLVVATETGFAPFVFKTLVDGQDTIVGSDVEMVKVIAKELGVEVEFSEMSFDNVLSSVQSGQADMGISGISVTEERKKSFDFSIPYYTATNKLIIKKADSTKLTSLEAFSELSVAAQKGSIQESVVKEQMAAANPISLTHTGEMINQLKNDQVDGVVLEEPIAKGYVAKNPDLMIADIELDSSASDAYAIALPKGSTKLKEKVDQALQKMIDSGQIEQMIQEAYDLSVKE